MDDFLTLAAQASPNARALVSLDGAITYAELNIQVAALSARLSAFGVKRGERVAVLLDRSVEAARLVHALARLRAVIVPLNTRLASSEMRHQIQEASCRWIFSTIENTPLTEAVTLDDLPPAIDSGQWLSGKLDLDTDFGVLFTSGTSGQPKGAVLTWGNIFWSATASAFRLGVLPDDRWLLTLPLYHIGGLSIILRSTLYGTSVVLPDFPSDHFDLHRLWKHLQESAISLVSLVPTMLYRIFEEHPLATDWPASLRLILLGGAAASPELLSRAVATDLPIAVTYGLSEAASQVATALPNLTHRKPGTAGRPLPWAHLRVMGEDGSELPPDEIGELQVSGATVMRGYLNNPDANAGVLPDGWLATGDLGYLDEEGDVWVVQRRSDLILSGGENIYPAEIETIICQHPAVDEACVIGISHPEWGQQITAGVVPQPNGKITPKGVQAFCRQHLAGFKVPRRIELLDYLPKTASGKVNREMLRKWIISSSTEK